MWQHIASVRPPRKQVRQRQRSILKMKICRFVILAVKSYSWQVHFLVHQSLADEQKSSIKDTWCVWGGVKERRDLTVYTSSPWMNLSVQLCSISSITD